VCVGHWRGSKKGSWARGRASWPRNPAMCAREGEVERSEVRGVRGALAGL
jgi:hypothetical protein